MDGMSGVVGVALNDRVVDNHIVGLRRKIEPEPDAPRRTCSPEIHGHRGHGRDARLRRRSPHAWYPIAVNSAATAVMAASCRCRCRACAS